MADEATVRARLEKVGQGHLLAFADELSAGDRAALVEQIDGLELEAMPGLIEKYVKHDTPVEIPGDLEPAAYYPHDPASSLRSWDEEAARAAGEALLKAGKVACFVVAGGQGSRLGYDGPKGCYPTGAVTDKSLFQIFAEQIKAAGTRYGKVVPWYIMTSPLNHEATVGFFEEHGYFGLDKGDVMFFQQGVMPSVGLDGRILLAEKGKVATNPDGHGGSLKALVKSGATADMKKRGVEHISYFQVDNPHVHPVDPVFLGLHASAVDSSGEMSSKMLPKAEAKEKVGVFCQSGGKTMVIEYSDMPDALSEKTDGDGNLAFNAGSIAIHAMSVAFVEKLANDPEFELPYHRANKKVAHIDVDTGEAVSPESPNAVKMERFVFDAIPLAQGSIVYETDRVEEFAPVKNKEGVDSIVTSKQLQTERAARWLEAAGVSVPRKADGTPDCMLEIKATTALFADDLRGASGLPESIEAGAAVEL